MLSRERRGPFLGATLVFLAIAGALAQGKDPVAERRLTESTTSAVRVPSTAQDHLAIASTYRERLAAHRADIRKYREDKAAEREKLVESPKGPANQLRRKMEERYDKLIAEAEQQAAEAERFARFHEMRAEELQGYPTEMFRMGAR